MQDLTQRTDNQQAYSVSDLASAVKRTVEAAFDYVRVRGEISRPTYARSGHLYFTLKDDKAVLDVVCWRGKVSQLPARAEEGLEIIASGRLTTYPGSSKYQLVLEHFELAGEGALLKLLEERKKRLMAEGLFADKKPLPYLPRLIGIVTSPTGAVIRDILHRISERFPRPILLYPVKVQGEGAAEEIATAIKAFNTLPENKRPDLLIVGRGGGSLEDLWAFNEEVVVRALASSLIPTISAVGHETDTTLADFAADLRVPTPTAAAERAVPVRTELKRNVQELSLRSNSAIWHLISRQHERVQGLARGLPRPERLIEEASFGLDNLIQRALNSIKNQLAIQKSELSNFSVRLKHPRDFLALQERELSRLKHQNILNIKRTLTQCHEKLTALNSQKRNKGALERRFAASHEKLDQLNQLLNSYKALETKALKRGYAKIMSKEGTVITTATSIKAGQNLILHFADGEVPALATLPSAAQKKKNPKVNLSEQGKLL